MKELNFITTNAGKYAEVSAMLASVGIPTVQRPLDCPEIQADTLEEVVSFCLDWLGDRDEAYLIDDSGLFIDALRGFPGVYSAYVFKTLGLSGILRLMEGIPDDERNARFETVFGMVIGGRKLVFRGVCRGRISREPAGDMGFGYDPIFVPDEGDGRTFAEMSTAEKNAVSHRGEAVRRMLEHADEIAELLNQP